MPNIIEDLSNQASNPAGLVKTGVDQTVGAVSNPVKTLRKWTFEPFNWADQQLYGGGSGRSKAREEESARLTQEEQEKLTGLSDEQYDVERSAGKELAGEEGAYDTKMREYQKDTESAMGAYGQDMANLKGQLGQAQAQHEKYYAGTLQPAMQNYMDMSKKESDSAMSLKDASDPNNPVASAFRNFYNKEAEGTKTRGMADVGVLSALGAQATANQIGGGSPITGSQMQLLQSGNMAQSGQAFANVQQRMNQLRQQGIEEGWKQTGQAYDRGVGARDRYGNAIGQATNMQQGYEAGGAGMRGEGSALAQNEMLGMQGLRGERGGYAKEQTEARKRGIGYTTQPKVGQLTRQGAITSGTYGSMQEGITAAEQAELARQQAGSQLAGSVIGATGQIVGGALSGRNKQ